MTNNYGFMVRAIREGYVILLLPHNKRLVLPLFAIHPNHRDYTYKEMVVMESFIGRYPVELMLSSNKIRGLRHG